MPNACKKLFLYNINNNTTTNRDNHTYTDLPPHMQTLCRRKTTKQGKKD